MFAAKPTRRFFQTKFPGGFCAAEPGDPCTNERKHLLLLDDLQGPNVSKRHLDIVGKGQTHHDFRS
jgi:hypothetical protein